MFGYDTLEKRGLVKRQPLEKDRRMKSVSITPNGLNLVKAASADMQEKIINVALHPLRREQIIDLNNTLSLLKKHLITLTS